MIREITVYSRLLVGRRRVEVTEASTRGVCYAVGLAEGVVAGAFWFVDGVVGVDFCGADVGYVGATVAGNFNIS